MNFFRTCFSFGAKSQFEKARLQATYAGDYDEPNEEDLQVILNTLSGKDLETRQQVAFATIVSKLETSESSDKWNYLLKNLIIFDRCVEQRIFLKDIQDLHLPSVERFKLLKNSFNSDYEGIVREYFRVIKEKAVLYFRSNSSYNIEKKYKRKYFEKLEMYKIFQELQEAQKMHERTFNLTNQSQVQYFEHQVVNYIWIYILSLYLNLYSTQYAAVSVVLDKLTSLGLEQSLQFEKLYNKFLQLSSSTVRFISNHSEIPGFEQIEKNDFYSTDQRIKNIIKSYIEMLRSNRGSNQDLYKAFNVVKLDKQNFNKDIEIISKPQQDIDIQHQPEQKLQTQQENNSSNFKQFYNPDSEEINIQALKPQQEQIIVKQENQMQNDSIVEEVKRPFDSGKLPSALKKVKSDNPRQVKTLEFKTSSDIVQISEKKVSYSLDFDQLQLGYSQFIKQSGMDKISRLDYERTYFGYEKQFCEQEDQEFNFSVFQSFQEIYSEKHMASSNSRKSQIKILSQQNSQANLQQDDKYYTNPFYVEIDDFDEENEVNMSMNQPQIEQKNNIQLDVDWLKLDQFDQSVFDSFRNNFSEDTNDVSVNNSQLNETQVSQNNQNNDNSDIKNTNNISSNNKQQKKNKKRNKKNK